MAGDTTFKEMVGLPLPPFKEKSLARTLLNLKVGIPDISHYSQTTLHKNVAKT
jgi:hypothetical protein